MGGYILDAGDEDVLEGVLSDELERQYSEARLELVFWVRPTGAPGLSEVVDGLDLRLHLLGET